MTASGRKAAQVNGTFFLSTTARKLLLQLDTQ